MSLLLYLLHWYVKQCYSLQHLPEFLETGYSEINTKWVHFCTFYLFLDKIFFPAGLVSRQYVWWAVWHSNTLNQSPTTGAYKQRYCTAQISGNNIGFLFKSSGNASWSSLNIYKWKTQRTLKINLDFSSVCRSAQPLEAIACRHSKVQYRVQQGFDAWDTVSPAWWISLSLKMEFQSQPSTLSFDRAYNWTCQWQFNVIHLFTNPSSESSITSSFRHTVSSPQRAPACEWGGQSCGWLCAGVGLPAFDPHSVSGQGVLFEQAAITVIGWHLEQCRSEPVWVLNKHREGSLPATDLCMSREGQEA